MLCLLITRFYIEAIARISLDQPKTQILRGTESTACECCSPIPHDSRARPFETKSILLLDAILPQGRPTHSVSFEGEPLPLAASTDGSVGVSAGEPDAALPILSSASAAAEPVPASLLATPTDDVADEPPRLRPEMLLSILASSVSSTAPDLLPFDSALLFLPPARRRLPPPARSCRLRPLPPEAKASSALVDVAPPPRGDGLPRLLETLSAAYMRALVGERDGDTDPSMEPATERRPSPSSSVSPCRRTARRLACTFAVSSCIFFKCSLN